MSPPDDPRPLGAEPLAGDDYDRLPYPSLPFADTQPTHLAGLAALFGVSVADPARARVLELGCAAGGNIVPLAARFPEASFVGVDLSRRHIDDGNARIAALGLSQIRFVQADLETLDLPGEQFDFIICNGVYSWVTDAARQAILRLCQRNLAPNGVATISYNVLPGWHLRMVVRDICLRHAGLDGPPRQRVAKARQALERFAASATADSPYGATLKLEAARLRSVPDAYIHGEFLAQQNQPVFVADLTARAASSRLHYLCEANLCAAVPPDLKPPVRQVLLRFGADRPSVEQQLDFLTGRLFRRSVFVPKAAVSGLAPAPLAERLAGLHLSSALQADPERDTAQGKVFMDECGRPVTAKLPVVVEALEALAASFPATVPVDQLLGLTANHAMRSRLCRTLLEIVMAGRATISVHALPVGRADDDRPAAWTLARVEAALGQPWITSLRHEPVFLHSVGRAILPFLDGALDVAALRDRVACGLTDGSIPSDLPAAGDGAEALLDDLLRQLERQALLQPKAA